MDEGEKAIVKEIALEVVAVIKTELLGSFKTLLELHSAQCPAKNSQKRTIAIVTGVVVGVPLVLKLLNVF